MLWGVALEDFVSHPILGVGTHNFEATYYQLRGTAVFHARQPHTLPLEVLSERGLVGGVLFFGFLGACLAAARSQVREPTPKEGAGRRADGRDNLLVRSLKRRMVLADTGRNVARDRLFSLAGHSLGTAAGITLSVANAGGRHGNRYAGDCRHYAAVRRRQLPCSGRRAANVESGLKSVELAQKFNPVDPDLPEREAEMAVATGDWSRAQESYARAVELDPQNYAPYYLAALLYERRGKPDNALPLYRKASSLNPRDEEIERRLERLEAVNASRAEPLQISTLGARDAVVPPSRAVNLCLAAGDVRCHAK